MSLRYRLTLDADEDALFVYKGHEYSHLKILLTGERIEDIVAKIRQAARQMEIMPNAVPNKPHAEQAIQRYIERLREIKPGHLKHDHYGDGGNQCFSIEAITQEFFHDHL